MSDRRFNWVGRPPTVRERFLALTMGAILILTTANNYYFGLGFLGLTPKQLDGVGLLLVLPFALYFSARVERR